jgi:hypothetical protein
MIRTGFQRPLELIFIAPGCEHRIGDLRHFLKTVLIDNQYMRYESS